MLFRSAALDSYSARAWFMATPRLVLQISAGHLKDAEFADVGRTAAPLAPRVTVNKVTASATYHHLSEKRVWASTIGWGRNSEPGSATNAVLAETNVTVGDRDTWYGRFETMAKSAEDLDVSVPGRDAFEIGRAHV